MHVIMHKQAESSISSYPGDLGPNQGICAELNLVTMVYLIDHTFYGFIGVITHAGCLENTRKVCTKDFATYTKLFYRQNTVVALYVGFVAVTKCCHNFPICKTRICPQVYGCRPNRLVCENMGETGLGADVFHHR